MQEYMEISITDILGPGSAFTPMPSLVSCMGRAAWSSGPGDLSHPGPGAQAWTLLPHPVHSCRFPPK